MTVIDLRSDTVTKPSAAMRRAIAEAVGRSPGRSASASAAACGSPAFSPPRRSTHSITISDGCRKTTRTPSCSPSDCRTVRPSAPETNIVMIDLARERDTVDAVLPKLAQAGVLLVPFGPRRLRAVTHLDVGGDDVERAASVIRRVLG